MGQAELAGPFLVQGVESNSKRKALPVLVGLERNKSSDRPLQGHESLPRTKEPCFGAQQMG